MIFESDGIEYLWRTADTDEESLSGSSKLVYTKYSLVVRTFHLMSRLLLFMKTNCASSAKQATMKVFVAVILFFFSISCSLAQPAETAKKYGNGPYIANERIVTALDCRDETCETSLSFATLLRRFFFIMNTKSAKQPPGTNPLSLAEARQIRETVKIDLDDIQARRIRDELNADIREYLQDKFSEFRISDRFLTNPNSRIDLVGIVNRMDRLFLGTKFAASSCGEISVIYRFWYFISGGGQTSRLPITMNVVFPAATDALDCKTVAQRWLEALELLMTVTPETTDSRIREIAAQLMDRRTGVLAEITPGNIARIELNIQAYRLPAGLVADFGSEAAYVIRVFQWDGNQQLFVPTVLPNQIDRSKILCPDQACKKRKQDLVAYLSRPDIVENVDRGLVNIPETMGVLAERALSISPGGSHRSGNQPYWNAVEGQPDIVTDNQLNDAIANAIRSGKVLTHINSAADFRARLNDSTCTGCHQTRAIAGFHFPGADREGEDLSNSVFLPGSPHFYGDQPRRLALVQEIATAKPGSDPDLSELLITSYSARPDDRFAKDLKDTQLIGGWGGACLIANEHGHKRNWPCRERLECAQLFRSRNDLDAGTCVPPISRVEIGDALQRGEIYTWGFGKDKYVRLQPKSDDNRIPDSALPKDPPKNNSYIGAHQEFFPGSTPRLDCRIFMDSKEREACYEQRRDSFTGGFPSGMLRLSECIGLPAEATCGLAASSGFNKCVSKIGTDQDYTIKTCFQHFTSYTGMRACDIAGPCRDDYICIKPIDYDKDTTWEERRGRISQGRFFEDANRRPYDPNDFGQAKPDDDWAERLDRTERGFCIPPYFVFQFRSDRHGQPEELTKFLLRR